MDIIGLRTAFETVGRRMPSDLTIEEDADVDGPGWAICFHERGHVEVLGRFATEDEACAELWRMATAGAPLPILVDVTLPAVRRAYWEGPGSTKTFAHPLDHTWLLDLSPDAAVLDYGCGYGRSLVELSERGFSNLTGADISWPMVMHARAYLPRARIIPLGYTPKLLHANGESSLILLLEVLTCIPDDTAQSAVIAELVRILAPSGVLVVSDLIQRDDSANRARYAQGRDRFGIDGVFATSDGAILRHHSPTHLRDLLEAAGLVIEKERTIEVPTTNGNTVTAQQLMARKPPSRRSAGR